MGWLGVEGGSAEGEGGSLLAPGDGARGGLFGREVAEMLLELLVAVGELAGLLAPYLRSPDVTGESDLASRGTSPGVAEHAVATAPELMAKLPHALRERRAHRRRACLRWLAGNAGAGNEQIRVALSITSASQVSTMLEHLRKAGLLVKVPGRPGSANTWSLSAAGEEALALLEVLAGLGVA